MRVDEGIIQGCIDTIKSAFEERDYSQILDLFTEDVVVYTILGKIEGKDKVRMLLESIPAEGAINASRADERDGEIVVDVSIKTELLPGLDKGRFTFTLEGEKIKSVRIDIL